MTVVGEGREVHGVVGLSVVDASIMPTIPSANIHLATLTMAERCAQLLGSQRSSGLPALPGDC
jgi:choline dehydrogenase-like flavoprotein